MTDINPYWDERTLVIYGLLAGYTKLGAAEISNSILELTNAQGNVLFCLNLLAILEQNQKIQHGGIWLNLHKYSQNLEDEPSAENRELKGKVQDIIDWELDSTEVSIASFAELTERIELATEHLHDCVTFELKATSKKWLRGIVQSYLALYQQNKLFSPTVGAYGTHHQQYTALTDYLDRPKPSHEVSRFLLPKNIRLLEALYSLVDKKKLEINGFSELGEPEAIQKPMFSVSVQTSQDIKDLQRVAVKGLKVEAHNYDPANGVLTIAGEHIQIIRQPNKKGENKESKQAQLMRMLFYSLGFPKPVPLKSIYTEAYVDSSNKVYSAKIVKKSSSLVTAINKLVQEKLEVNDLIKNDKYKFYINERYLKN